MISFYVTRFCSAKEEPEEIVVPDDDAPALAEIKDAQKYDEIFRPHKELCK